MSYGNSLSLHRPATTQTTSSSKPVYPAGTPVKSTRCCETGRPVMMDPISGRTICSCQLKTSASAYLSRVPGLPDAVYGSSTSPVFQPNVVIGNDPTSAFYSMGLKGERPTDGVPPASPSGASSYYLEHLMAAHPYNAFYPGFDFNSARRKNATRETTSALKAWLYEHRKNPYPTKGEKIMLAIITRMTLTQVSTWFANARRRLKKENKIDDKDGTLCEIDFDEKDEDDRVSGDLSGSDDEADKNKHRTDLSDISDTDEPCASGKVSASCVERLSRQEEKAPSVQDYRTPFDLSDNKRHVSNYVTGLPTGSRIIKMDDRKSRDNSLPGNDVALPRPKIWSISEIISKSSSTES